MKHYKDPVIKQPRQDLIDFPCLDLCDRGGRGPRSKVTSVVCFLVFVKGQIF